MRQILKRLGLIKENIRRESIRQVLNNRSFTYEGYLSSLGKKNILKGVKHA